MQEHRQATRRKTYLGARLIYNHRQSTMDCLLRNFDERGAKLVFGHSTLVPDEFDLQVARMEQVFRAQVVWRRKNELGVRFSSPSESSNVVPLGLAIRMRKLEAEKLRLQQRVSQLTDGA